MLVQAMMNSMKIYDLSDMGFDKNSDMEYT